VQTTLKLTIKSRSTMWKCTTNYSQEQPETPTHPKTKPKKQTTNQPNQIKKFSKTEKSLEVE
jgi:hypothetical protein